MFEDVEKIREWAKLRGKIEDSIERSYNSFAPLGRAPDMCKRQRLGEYFTTDDLPALRALVTKKDFDDCWEAAQEEERHAAEQRRWDRLRRKWAEDEANGAPHEPDGGVPGVFHVSQTLNQDYDTYGSFVCTAPDEASARCMHPGGGNSFTYKSGALRRNEEWLARGNRGRAPPWFLGDSDSWCHGAYVHVKRISDYTPSANSKPEYGIFNASYRSG
jgi:hypothetical protein